MQPQTLVRLRQKAIEEEEAVQEEGVEEGVGPGGVGAEEEAEVKLIR